MELANETAIKNTLKAVRIYYIFYFIFRCGASREHVCRFTHFSDFTFCVSGVGFCSELDCSLRRAHTDP